MKFRELLEAKLKINDGVGFKYKGNEWNGKIKSIKGSKYTIEVTDPISDWKSLFNNLNPEVPDFAIKSVNGEKR